jgi:hypothetical protein
MSAGRPPTPHARAAPAPALEDEQQDAVGGQEDRGGRRRREQAAQRVLEQQPEDAGRDRADDEQPAQPGVAVAGGDLAVAQRAPQPGEDPPPLGEEHREEHHGGGEVRRDEEGQEVIVVLMDVPAEQPGQDDGVAKARDRERLRDALEQPQDDRLEVGDRVHAGDARSPS